MIIRHHWQDGGGIRGDREATLLRQLIVAQREKTAYRTSIFPDRPGPPEELAEELAEVSYSRRQTLSSRRAFRSLLLSLAHWICMVTHTTYSKSMDQPGKVANPARGQLNKKK